MNGSTENILLEYCTCIQYVRVQEERTSLLVRVTIPHHLGHRLNIMQGGAGLWLGTWLRFITRTRLAPFVPTPPDVVERMLTLARLKEGERLVDLFAMPMATA